MKFSPLFIFLSAALFPTAGFAQAPQPDNPPAPAQEAPQKTADITEVLINQPFSAKTLGDLTLPFMWDVQEDEKLKRLVITETRTPTPAVMTVDLVPVPDELDMLDAARGVVNSLAGALGTAVEVSGQKKTLECGKKKCPSVDVYKALISGNENNIPRKCAVQLVPAGKSDLLVLTICALADKQYSPELPEILDTFFGMMK